MAIQECLYEDQRTLTLVVADKVLNILQRAIDEKDSASLVVSGGSTPKALFSLLAKQSFEWDKVTITLADERWVSSEHADSNEKLVRDFLLQDKAAKAKFIGLYEANVEAKQAEGIIASRVDNIADKFDVVLLGMGEDGHTASLFPCSAELEQGLDLSRTTSVIAVTPTSANHQRMSLSLAKIVDARNVILHITGDKKKQVLDHALEHCTPLQKPIKAVCDNAQVTLMWAP